MQLEIQGTNFPMGQELKDYADLRLRTALGPFAHRIDRVSMSLRDVNGPRGGADTRCQVAVELRPRGSLIFKGLVGDNPFALISHASKRVGRSVRKALSKRRGAARRSRLAAVPAGHLPDDGTDEGAGVAEEHEGLVEVV